MAATAKSSGVWSRGRGSAWSPSPQFRPFCCRVRPLPGGRRASQDSSREASRAWPGRRLSNRSRALRVALTSPPHRHAPGDAASRCSRSWCEIGQRRSGLEGWQTPAGRLLFARCPLSCRDLSAIPEFGTICGAECGLFGQIPQDSLGIPRDRGILDTFGWGVPGRIPVVTRRGGGTCESDESCLRLSDLTTRAVQPGGMRKSRAARV